MDSSLYTIHSNHPKNKQTQISSTNSDSISHSPLLANNPNNPTTSTTAANFHLKVQSASLVSSGGGGAIAATQPAQATNKLIGNNKLQVSSSRFAAASTLENRRKRGAAADTRSDAAARRSHQLSQGGRKVHFDHIEMSASNVDDALALAAEMKASGVRAANITKNKRGSYSSRTRQGSVNHRLQVDNNAAGGRCPPNIIEADDGEIKRTQSAARGSISVGISDSANELLLSNASQNDRHSGDSVSQRSCYSYRSSRFSQNASTYRNGAGAKKKKRRRKNNKNSGQNKLQVNNDESMAQKPARIINQTGSQKQLPAGRPFNEPTVRRKLQHQSNQQLNAMIGDFKGHVPTFGYPLINYSPKHTTRKLTDAAVWKKAIVTDGSAIKDLTDSEYVMKSTAQLKFELTEKQDKATQRMNQFNEQKKQNRISGVEGNLSVSQHYPPGVKCHIYQELQEEEQRESNLRNQWRNIYTLLGVQAGQYQNIITEILASYYKQSDRMEHIFGKFQRGERIEQADLKEDPSNYLSRGFSLNFTQAMRDHARAGVYGQQRSRFTNLKSAISRSTKMSSTNVGMSNSQPHLQPKDALLRGQEAAAEAEASHRSISNAKQLMDFIAMQNAKREYKRRLARERRCGTTSRDPQGHIILTGSPQNFNKTASTGFVGQIGANGTNTNNVKQQQEELLVDLKVKPGSMLMARRKSMQLNGGIQRSATLTKSMPIIDPTSFSRRQILNGVDTISVSQLKDDDSSFQRGGVDTGLAQTLLLGDKNSKNQRKSACYKKGSFGKASTLQTHDYKQLLKLNSNLSERLVEGLIYESIRKSTTNEEEQQEQQQAQESGYNLPVDADNDQTLYQNDTSEAKIDMEKSISNYCQPTSPNQQIKKKKIFKKQKLTKHKNRFSLEKAQKSHNSGLFNQRKCDLQINISTIDHSQPESYFKDLSAANKNRPGINKSNTNNSFVKDTIKTRRVSVQNNNPLTNNESLPPLKHPAAMQPPTTEMKLIDKILLDNLATVESEEHDQPHSLSCSPDGPMEKQAAESGSQQQQEQQQHYLAMSEHVSQTGITTARLPGASTTCQGGRFDSVMQGSSPTNASHIMPSFNNRAIINNGGQTTAKSISVFNPSAEVGKEQQSLGGTASESQISSFVQSQRLKNQQATLIALQDAYNSKPSNTMSKQHMHRKSEQPISSKRNTELKLNLENNNNLNKMKRAKHIEERNSVLVHSVRKNMEKIDKIVNRLAIPAPMAFSRVTARNSSMTDPKTEQTTTHYSLTNNEQLVVESYRASAEPLINTARPTNHNKNSSQSQLSTLPTGLRRLHPNVQSLIVRKNNYSMQPALVKQGGKNSSNLQSNNQPLAVSSSCTNASRLAKKRKMRPERSINLLKKQHNLQQTAGGGGHNQFSWTHSAANNSATFASLTGGENEGKGGAGGAVDLQHPPPTSEKPTTVNCSPKTFIDTVSTTNNRLHTSGFHPRKMEQLDQRRQELQAKRNNYTNVSGAIDTSGQSYQVGGYVISPKTNTINAAVLASNTTTHQSNSKSTLMMTKQHQQNSKANSTVKKKQSGKLMLRKPAQSGFLETNPVLSNSRLLRPLKHSVNDSASNNNLIIPPSKSGAESSLL